jgi:hypothetical protein
VHGPADSSRFGEGTERGGKAAAKRRRAPEIQFIGQPDKIEVSDPNNDAFSERARWLNPGWV